MSYSRVGLLTDNYPVGASNPLPVQMGSMQQTPSGALRVGTSQTKFRDDFDTFDTVNNWTVVRSPAGMTVGVAGSANGARYLNINSGTNSGDEFIMVSKQSFSYPMKCIVGLSASARPVGLEMYVELVGEDEANPGTVKTDTSIASSPTFEDARDGVGMMFNGTQSTTQGQMQVRGAGISEFNSGAVTFAATHLTGTGTTPDFIAKQQYEFMLRSDYLQAGTRAINSTAAAVVTLNKSDYIPDPNKKYLIRIRLKNTTTVTATDYRVHFVRVLDATTFSIDYGIIGGATADILSAPVKVVSGAVTATVTAATMYQIIAAAAATGIALTPHTLISAATTNATSVKTSAGRIASGRITNSSASWRYLKLFNKASAPTVGTDTPVLQIPIAPNDDASISDIANQYGISFATGIAYAITGGSAALDNTAIAAGEVLVNLQYI